MGLLGRTSSVGSPQQHHQVHVANDVLWVDGDLQTLGDPHNYINQEGLDFLRIMNPHLAPWAFTGLPSSHTQEIVIVRERVQFLLFPSQETVQKFRKPPRTELVVMHLPMAVIQGHAPFLSEAKLHNFMDFWKGIFFPIVDAEIYYLSGGPAEFPQEIPLVYINRHIVQSYYAG